jgi:transposase
MLQSDRNRWQYRARACLRAWGLTPRAGAHYRCHKAMPGYLAEDSGLEASRCQMLALCQRQEASLAAEVRAVEGQLRGKAREIDAIARLKTIPGVGDLVATTIYAWVGEIARFPDTKSLGAYAGLVPAVWQSAASHTTGQITKQGSKALRSALGQSAHLLMNRGRSAEAAPLRAIGARIQTARKRRKIAAVALARHLLRVAFYILRDGPTYSPELLCGSQAAADPQGLSARAREAGTPSISTWSGATVAEPKIWPPSTAT